MHLRRILALTLFVALTGCERPPSPAGSVPWFDAFAHGAFLARDPWLDVVELYRSQNAEEDGGLAWSVPRSRTLEVVDGWGGSEEWGAWGLGERTRFRFLLRRTGSYDFFIEALGPPGSDERPQTVRVRLNGEDVDSSTVDREWHELRFAVPEKLLHPGWNDLELVYGYSLAGNLESDDRRLALAFERLGLVPAGQAPPKAGGSPGYRVFRDQQALVLEAAGHYVVPLEVPEDAVSLDFEVTASGGGEKSLAVGLMTIDGRQRTVARISGAEPLSLDLAEERGASLILTLETDLGPGGRFTLRRPAMVLDPAAAASAQTPVPAPGRRPIVLIVLDAARADHFGVYGYERDTTPAIDALAAESLVFENVVAECSYTLCSMPSLLTGLSYPQHGMVAKELVLKDEVTTLAEMLSEAGYLTVGYTGNPNNSTVTGTEQGFEEFYEIWKTHPRHITNRVAGRIERGDFRGQPFFLMLHYVPPHEPYAPDADFDVFSDPGYSGPVTSDREFTRDVYAMKIELDHDDLAEMVALYDGNLRMADASVGRILDALKAAGIYEEALVVVTSDHGEAFLEHGRVGHNTTIYGEMMRIPLIVKLPESWKHRAEGVDLGRLATLADVPATILALLGIEAPDELESSNLLAVAASPRRLVYQRSAQLDAPVLGVRTPRFKALAQAGARPEIYDVVADPEETENLIVENPLLHTGLALILARAIREPGPLRAGVREGEISDKDKAMLRALGYL